MADYYVDSDAADDSGSGLTYASPKKTIGAILDVAMTNSTYPFEETITIHCYTRTVTYLWNAAGDQSIDLSAVRCVGDGMLIFQPISDAGETAAGGWVQNDYEDLKDPFNNSGTWDPTCTKPVTFDPVTVTGPAGPIEIRGTSIGAADGEAMPLAVNGADVSLVYCSVSSCGGVGVMADYDGRVGIENSSLVNMDVGVGAGAGSRVVLMGTNYITNVGRIGLCGVGGDFSVMPWNNLDGYATTQIKLETPRRNFAAVLLYGGSTLDLLNGPEVVGMMLAQPGFLHVINEADVTGSDFVGVKLSAGAMLLGAGNVYFTDPSTTDDKVTVPAGQQIVTASAEGCVVVQ